MTMRAWISLRIGKTSTDEKHAGDVLCVKLPDSPVGEREWKEFLIIDDWPDDDLEKRLQTLRDAGEPHPVITHPYAVLDDGGNVVLRSTWRVDVDALADRAAVLDKTVVKSPRLTRDTPLTDVRE